MLFQRIFDGLFARPDPPRFTSDLPGDETSGLQREMQDCLKRAGGTLATVRRTEALANLFSGLSPDGKRLYVDTLKSLDGTGGRSAADSYSEIEEAELFGRPSSKLTILDAFETPVRRMLTALKGTSNGSALISEIKFFADEDLQNEIKNL